MISSTVLITISQVWAGAGLLGHQAVGLSFVPVAFALGMLFRSRVQAEGNTQRGPVGDPAASPAAIHARLSEPRRPVVQWWRGPAAKNSVVADHERRRIARDLHDGLQVQLVLLGLQAQEMAAYAEGQAADRATALRDGIDHAAAALRQVVCGLMPPPLVERGLQAALEDLCDRLPLDGRVHVAVSDGSLPPVVESTAYFVVSEAATNAVKHARARVLEVTVERVGEALLVEVSDDGVGGARISGGYGLANLAERVELLGGAVYVESPPGRGTHVAATLPCASRRLVGASATN